jgi:RHS repeat-associated protein
MLKFSTTNGFAYDAAGNLLRVGGLWSGDTVSYSYANRLRSGLNVGSWHQSYGYDAALRLTNLLSMAGSFGYAYDPVRLYRVDKLSLPNSAYIACHYDSLTRLLGTDLTRGTDNHVLDGYTYRYDLLGQRTGISRNNGFSSSTVSAGYDAIGELTSWSATEPDNAARFNEQLIYAYDAAGNLQQRWNHQFMQSFTVDAANELTNVTRGGVLTVTGNTPTPPSSVTINGQPAVTYGDFTFASSSGFALADGLNAFTNIAGNYSATVMVTNTLSVNLPASVNLQFDANGNLTNDGTRVFGYDAENQLTNVTVTGQWREDFLYDGLNRRRITRQYGWTGNAWALTNETRFVYDGKAVIQEWDSNNVAQVSYTRGRDASGSRQGAGGIGGLLARTDATGSTYYHADGNGNITALMDGNQYIVARYLYDPFGRMLGKWGTLADANVYRFSSKEWDGSAGLYDYLYRFYDPNLQRWLSRDPIGELGGINLYGFVGNNPIDFMDPYGLAWFDDLANWAQTQNAQFKDGMNATAGNENSWVTAGALDTVSDFAAGLLSYPQAISQLGAAEGNFSVDPSLNNLAAVANDVAIAADVIAAGAAPLPGLRGKKTCPAGGPCFAAGTKVSTPSGETNIEDIKIGDMVYAYDFDNGNVVELYQD